MLNVRTKLLFKSAKAQKLQFASVTVGDTTIYFDEVYDGAAVWIEVDGDIQPAPDIDSVDIDGVIYTIKDSCMYLLETETMEEVLPEEANTDDTQSGYDDTELRTMIADLTARIEALEAKLLEPQTDPVEVEKYSKSKNKKIDLSKFGI